MCADPQIVLVVTATGREADSLAESLTTWGVDAIIFPSWETLPHERLSPSSETIANRVQALRRVRTWNGAQSLVVIASVRAALQPISAAVADSAPLTLAVGERHNLLDVSRALLERGYQRVDMVSRRGEMAVRGGILDVFPPLGGHPCRVDFFGDEIDEIREFSIADQRSLATVKSVEASAVREILLTPEVRKRAAKLAERVPSLRSLAEPIAEGIAVPGMESLLPALVDKVVPLVSFFPDSASVIVVGPDRVRARAESLRLTNQEFLAAAWHSVGDGGEVHQLVHREEAREEVGDLRELLVVELDRQGGEALREVVRDGERRRRRELERGAGGVGRHDPAFYTGRRARGGREAR